MTALQLEARNPDTSPRRLVELLYGFTDDVLKNPALPLILLENPAWLNEIDTERLRTLLNKPQLPAYLVEALEKNAYPPVVANAKMHVALGTEITDWTLLLTNLATLNCSREDRLALEQHNLIPEWLRFYLPPVPAARAKRKWLTDSEPLAPLPAQEAEAIRNLPERERTQLAYTTQSAAVLRVLAKDTSSQVKWRVAKNSRTSQEDLEYLKEFRYCLGNIASNPATSLQILLELANLTPSLQRLEMECIARNPNCTAELALQLRKTVTPGAALARFYTTEELVEFFQQGDTWAAEEARRRDNAPQWLVVQGLMLDTIKRRAFLPWFCGLLATGDQKRLTKNVRSGNWFTRFAIAIHPGTTPGTLEKLVTDANRYVRFTAKARTTNPEWSFAFEVGYE